jgi:hypothetical protein
MFEGYHDYLHAAFIACIFHVLLLLSARTMRLDHKSEGRERPLLLSETTVTIYRTRAKPHTNVVQD